MTSSTDALLTGQHNDRMNGFENFSSILVSTLLPIVLPVLFWSGYHYYKDRHLPEPLPHLFVAFGIGMASFWLGMLMYEGLGLIGLRFDAYALAETNRFGLLFYAILGIGVIEELAKIVPFILVAVRFREFDEPIDGIIYASFIALGFAAVENYHYLQYLTGNEAIARGFAGPVVHIVFASVWGFYIGCAYLKQKALVKTVAVALAATAVMHGIYDFIAIAMPTTALPVSAFLVLALWVWRLRLIRELHVRAGHRPRERD